MNRLSKSFSPRMWVWYWTVVLAVVVPAIVAIGVVDRDGLLIAFGVGGAGVSVAMIGLWRRRSGR